MKIAIPIPRGGVEPYGFGLYLRRLMAAMAAIDRDNEYWFVHPPGPVPDLSPAPAKSKTIEAGPHWHPTQWRSGPLVRATEGADVVHFYNNTVWLKKARPTVVTLHDLSYVTAPDAEQARGLTALYIRWLYRKIAANADRIIAVSETTAVDVRTRLGVPAERVAVVLEGPTPGIREATPQDVDRVRGKYRIDAPYYLYVGSHGPRKNLPGMIRAVARARTNQLFVLTGSKPDAVGYRGVDVGDAPWLREVGYVPLEDLSALYTGAEALLYVTFYEGFGFPILEAYACGTPVVVSDRGSSPEIAGDIAPAVDPHDEGALVAALRNLKFDRAKARERVKAFSWERAALQTLDVYRAVAR